jgi:hypothetical protein
VGRLPAYFLLLPGKRIITYLVFFPAFPVIKNGQRIMISDTHCMITTDKIPTVLIERITPGSFLQMCRADLNE